MQPSFLTFTGVDEKTSISQLVEISTKYSIEWGILFSPKRQGMDPRYPDLDFIDSVRRLGLRLSAHLCGEYSRRVFRGDPLGISLEGFARVQVNSKTVGSIQPVLNHRELHGREVIMQCRGGFPKDGRVRWLFDASGGKGLSPRQWPEPPVKKHALVGYSGGISPGNIEETLRRVPTTTPYWLDMESSLRKSDWFSLDRCKYVCEKTFASGGTPS